MGKYCSKNYTNENERQNEAYRIVFNDMKNKMDCKGMFFGNYDAKNGSNQFMYGVALVMEWLAFNVSIAEYEDFMDIFTNNMIESERKVGAKV